MGVYLLKVLDPNGRPNSTHRCCPFSFAFMPMLQTMVWHGIVCKKGIQPEDRSGMCAPGSARAFPKQGRREKPYSQCKQPYKGFDNSVRGFHIQIANVPQPLPVYRTGQIAQHRVTLSLPF